MSIISLILSFKSDTLSFISNYNFFLFIWTSINGSGWIIELIESQCINISTHRPLSGSSYIDLPVELRSQKKSMNKH